MNTDERLEAYTVSLKNWAWGVKFGTFRASDHPEPNPKDYSLVTPMDLWCAAKLGAQIKKEILG